MIHAALTAIAALTLYLTTATLGWMALKSAHHPLERLRDVDGASSSHAGAMQHDR